MTTAPALTHAPRPTAANRPLVDIADPWKRGEVRVAVQADPAQPPHVELLQADDPADLVEEAFARTAVHTGLPVLAVREILENLVHARFASATVTVLDGGRTVRVTDTGPGIPDTSRALQPGFTTADEAARRIIRGVGSGLPLALRVMEMHGGHLDIQSNLGTGTVATLHAADSPVVEAPSGLSESARRILALLVETGPAAPARVAAELALPVGECGRELVLLEHRGLVARTGDGARHLTAAGTTLLETLF